MENKKVFINAMFSSLRFQYVFLLIIFLILPIAYLVKDAVFQLDEIDINYLLIKFFVLLVGIILFRQIWVFEIMTSAQGISYYGFFKKIYASWYEVISIKQSLSPTLGKLKTKNGNFYFPLWMKGKNETYPKFTIGLLHYKWVDENGVKKKVTLENCPLYVEIQKHLGNK